MLDVEGEGVVRRVQTACDVEHGRAGLAIPQGKLAEVGFIGIGHGGAEIVAGDGAAVVAFEIKLHAFLKACFAEHGVIHAHHFCAFFIHGHGVEIVHFFIRCRANRMRHGACVFGKLQLAQEAHVFDAAHGTAGAIAREFLVAKHGEAFFERQLKPIAAGHAVAGVVVEIFVADYRFDALEIGIGGGAAVGQHIFGVENIQAFVFHRAHIKVAHGHHHIDIEIVFEAEAGFVPLHGVFQRLHRKRHFGFVCFAGVKLNRYVFAALRGERVARGGQVARHQRKQIARFGKGIEPFHPMAAAFQIAAVDFVAVGEQHRIAFFVGNNGGGEFAHHIGAVGIISDFAETFRLALGVEIAA